MNTVPKLFVAKGFRSQTKKEAIKSSSTKQSTKCHCCHISFFVKEKNNLTVSKPFQVVNLTNTQLTEPFFFILATSPPTTKSPQTTTSLPETTKPPSTTASPTTTTSSTPTTGNDYNNLRYCHYDHRRRKLTWALVRKLTHLLTMLNVAFYRINMGKITKGRAEKPAQTLFKTTQEHKIQQQVSLY